METPTSQSFDVITECDASPSIARPHWQKWNRRHRCALPQSVWICSTFMLLALCFFLLWSGRDSETVQNTYEHGFSTDLGTI